MKRGFTLIELLVVIAIIAILAAILFPVFARAREKARQTTCLNNVKQMALGVQMYAQDFDETVIPYYQDGNPSSPVNMRLWWNILHPYVMNMQVYLCPSSYLSGAASERGYSNYMDYGMNRRCATRGTATPTVVRMAEIRYPAETFIIADGDWTRSTADHSGSNGWDLMPTSPQTYNASSFIPARHNGGANIAFMDGHAKWWHIRLDPNSPYVGPVKYTLWPTDIAWYPSGSPKY